MTTIKYPLLNEDYLSSKENPKFIESVEEPSNEITDSFSRSIGSYPSNSREELQKIYLPNVIKTSRYTLLTFFPQSLFEQFRRLANVYFLVLGTIAAIGEYTNYYETAVQAVGILTPMMTVVLISVIKDGVEDIKRHHADLRINKKKTKVVSRAGDVNVVEWQDLLPGDMVLLSNGDELPADIVVVACGGIQGPVCYVETAAIDGETSLKPKRPCLIADAEAGGTKGKGTASCGISISPDKSKVIGLEPLRFTAVVEAPTEIIDGCNGFASFTDLSGKAHNSALTKDNLLLRGSVLRASEWCVGMVVYTGRETKLSMNSKKAPSKLSSVDRVVNRTLLIAMSTMLVVCVLSMILGILWSEDNKDASYLCLHKNSLDDVYGNVGGCNSSAAESVLTIFTFATLYNNFVCISMYVSLEMVYLCQSYFISQDLNLYDPTTDTPAECHSSGLCADLGQVQYVLSDKTGTLTKNVMKLRRVSVAGCKYGAPILLPSVGGGPSPVPPAPAPTPAHSRAASLATSERPSALSSTRPISKAGPSEFDFHLFHDATADQWRPLTDLSLHHRGDETPGTDAIVTATIRDFIRVLVACNTVIIMPDDSGSSSIFDLQSLEKHLQAESPDEVALVHAAAEYTGTLLVSRVDSTVSIRKTLHPASGSAAGEVEYETEEITVLAVNAFDSDRKRMSVLVRVGVKFMLLCKGADCTLLPLCREGRFSVDCMDHVDTFASTGLRTLVMAQRELTEAEATAWLVEHKAASNSVSRRQELLVKCALLVEKDFELLGAVGVEDELQDGVPQAITTLLRAGLNVWMITGDKAETALAISQQCCLLTEEHEVEKVVGLSGEALRQRILDLHGYIEGRMSVNSTSGNRYSMSIAPEAVMFQSEGRLPSSRSSSKAFNGLDDEGRKKVALLVDGSSLEALWALPDLKARFTQAIRSVPTVIACRVSPKQKSALVRMVKTGAGNPITLSIGDGANDVGMIHEARVGVGIAGREGRHAANSADFAIGQFRFLVPLMLEHGRYNYIRCSTLVLYSFYKNLVLVSVLFYYCIYSGYSGTVPLDSIVFSGYNFYLGLPIVTLGALDFDVPREFVRKYPYLAYCTGRCGELLNLANMGRWCAFAFVQGLLLFIVAVRIMAGTNTLLESNFEIRTAGVGMINSDGKPGGLFVEGYLLYTCAVVAMQYKVMLITNSRTWINWSLWVLSFAGYMLFTYMYGLFPSLDWFNVVPLAFNVPNFWFSIVLIPVLMTMFDILIDGILSKFFPTSQQALQDIVASELLNNRASENAEKLATPVVVGDVTEAHAAVVKADPRGSLEIPAERLSNTSRSGQMRAPSFTMGRVSESLGMTAASSLTRSDMSGSGSYESYHITASPMTEDLVDPVVI